MSLSLKDKIQQIIAPITVDNFQNIESRRPNVLTINYSDLLDNTSDVMRQVMEFGGSSITEEN